MNNLIYINSRCPSITNKPKEIKMKITKLLDKNLIDLDLDINNKEEILKEMAGLLKKEDKVKSKDKFLAKIIEREREGSTGFGRGIAVPHGKSETVNELSLAIGRSKDGVEYQSMDGKKVQLKMPTIH